jgi:hypothetical protein
MGLGSGIRDPEKTYFGSRIRVQGSKRHRIPDPDPQHCLLASRISKYLAVIVTHFAFILSLHTVPMFERSTLHTEFRLGFALALWALCGLEAFLRCIKIEEIVQD